MKVKMQIEFHSQQVAESISTRDKIELYNCEDHQMNGNYIVADIDPETFEITLVGTGAKSGFITMICLNAEE